MHFFLSVAIGSIATELATIGFRILGGMRSGRIQKRLGIPRIHHGYVGVILTLAWIVAHTPFWVGAVGLMLIISDLSHHLVVEPLLRFFQLDTGMLYEVIFRKYLGYFFITLSTLLLFVLSLYLAHF